MGCAAEAVGGSGVSPWTRGTFQNLSVHLCGQHLLVAQSRKLGAGTTRPRLARQISIRLGIRSIQKGEDPFSLLQRAGVFNVERVDDHEVRHQLHAISLESAYLRADRTTSYSMDFVKHTYLYHFTRIDHRHNFSVYNTVLHLNSAYPDQASSFKIESLAFVPQLCLSVLAIPFYLSEKDLAGTMLAQTFAFVTFNKVCTSQVRIPTAINLDSWLIVRQYFLWYMVFLPFYLPNSSFWRKPRLGIAALVLWVLGQAAWLQQGFELEFMGKSTFVPGLWLAGIAFFLINCWILGVIVADIGSSGATTVSPSAGGKLKKDR